jgi:hypothetical protein
MPVEWSQLQDQPGTWEGILLLLLLHQPLRCFNSSSLPLVTTGVDQPPAPARGTTRSSPRLLQSLSDTFLTLAPPTWAPADALLASQCWGCIQIKNRLLPSKFASNHL